LLFARRDVLSGRVSVYRDFSNLFFFSFFHIHVNVVDSHQAPIKYLISVLLVIINNLS